MKIVDTFQATIYVGFKEHYDGLEHTLDEVEKICQDFCDKVGLCVTITPTRYIYTEGNENGCIVGLINYPRFPSSNGKIFNKAISLAEILMKEFNQYKVTIVSSSKTIMLEAEED